MKNTDIEFILNHCLNNAMCGSERIKGIVTSNKIAEFVTDWVKANKLNIGVVSKCEGNFERRNLLIAFYQYIQENDIDHNIPQRIEKMVDKYLSNL